MTGYRLRLSTEWSPVGWTVRFEPANDGPMRLPMTLRWNDGEMVLDASFLGAGSFPVRHVWMDSQGGDTEAWLRHLGTPGRALAEPSDESFEGHLGGATEVALTEAARARFLGVSDPIHWPEGLPVPQVLGARPCAASPIPDSPVTWCHPATAPVGLHLTKEPLVEEDRENDRVNVSVLAETDATDIGAALVFDDQVLSSNRLSPGDATWTGSIPLYGHSLEDVYLDIFDPKVGVGLPVDSRPEAWAALRTFAGRYWRAELPDREQSRLVLVVRNGLGESFEVRPQVNGSGAPAMRRFALVELRCAWFGEELDPGACAVDRALAFAGLNDSASAVQAAMGAGVEWLLRASAEAADGNWPQIQGELRRACESLSDLVDEPEADDLRASGELLAARPDLEDELRELLQPEPARVLGIPPTAFDKGRQWVQSRQSLLSLDWVGYEPDRPLLAEWWAADVRR